MIGEVKKCVYTTVEDGKNVEHSFDLKTDISTTNKLSLVNSVVDSVVVDGHYYSLILDTVFDFSLVKFFTDVDTKAYETVSEIENFLVNTNLAVIVKTNINIGVETELRLAVIKDIEYRTGVKNHVYDDVILDIANTIKDMMKQVDIKAVVDSAQKMSTMQEKFTPESIVDAFIESGYLEDSLKRKTKRTKN